MKYLDKAPIRFTAPKGGWPQDWEEQPKAEKTIIGQHVDLDAWEEKERELAGK